MGGIRKELGEQFRSLGVATTMASSVVFSIFAGVITGHYLDLWLFGGRSYWLTVICLLFGIAGGIKNFMILSKRFSKEAEEKRQNKGQGSKNDDKGNVGGRAR